MADKQRTQASLGRFYAKVTKVQHEALVQAAIVSSREAQLEAERAEEEAPATVKRKPGRPRKVSAVNVVSESPALPNAMNQTAADTPSVQQPQGSAQQPSEQGSNQPESKPKRGKYKDWFSEPGAVNTIVKAVKAYGGSCRPAVAHLQRTQPITFSSLNESTTRGWFIKGQAGILKPKYQQYYNSHTSRKPGPGRPSILNRVTGQDNTTLAGAAVTTLKSMRAAGVAVNLAIVRSVVIGILLATGAAVGLLAGHGGSFQASRPWCSNFARDHLGWSWRAATTSAQKLPDSWELQGQLMVYRLGVWVHTYKVPPDLVINFDQTGTHFVPMANTHTYEVSGSKDIAVLGVEDKRAFTTVVGSTASGVLLPFQAVYQGRSDRSLPKGRGFTAGVQSGFHFTWSDNHWSSMETMQQYIEKVIQPYVQGTMRRLGLKSDQKAVLVLDCWSVHKSEEFRGWMADNHPNLLMLYVPAGTTSKYQPADLVLNRPFKHGMKMDFMVWSAQQVQEQVRDGKDLNHVRLEFSIGVLRDNSAVWMHDTWKHLSQETAMVKRGWEKAGFMAAWSKDTQVEAFMLHAKKELFGDNSDLHAGWTVIDEELDTPEYDDDDFLPLDLLTHKVLKEQAEAHAAAEAQAAAEADAAAIEPHLQAHQSELAYMGDLDHAVDELADNDDVNDDCDVEDDYDVDDVGASPVTPTEGGATSYQYVSEDTLALFEASDEYLLHVAAAFHRLGMRWADASYDLIADALEQKAHDYGGTVGTDDMGLVVTEAMYQHALGDSIRIADMMTEHGCYVTEALDAVYDLCLTEEALSYAAAAEPSPYKARRME